MLGKRKAFRVKRSFYVKWTLLGKSLRGEGKVSDHSVSGMNMQIYTPFEPAVGDRVIIEAVVKDTTLPESKFAKIVWFKKLLGGMQGFECGLQFIERE
jgi:hypothetical protein